MDGTIPMAMASWMFGTGAVSSLWTWSGVMKKSLRRGLTRMRKTVMGKHRLLCDIGITSLCFVLLIAVVFLITCCLHFILGEKAAEILSGVLGIPVGAVTMSIWERL